MRKYKSHKVVEAAKVVEAKRVLDPAVPTGPAELVGITDEFGYVHTLPPSFLKHAKDGNLENFVGGYLVRYEPLQGETEGYLSWSPAEAFEKGYTLLEESAEPDAEFWVSRDVDSSCCFLWKSACPQLVDGVWLYTRPTPTDAHCRILFSGFEFSLGFRPEPGKCLHVRRYGRRFEVVEVEG